MNRPLELMICWPWWIWPPLEWTIVVRPPMPEPRPRPIDPPNPRAQAAPDSKNRTTRTNNIVRDFIRASQLYFDHRKLGFVKSSVITRGPRRESLRPTANGERP